MFREKNTPTYLLIIALAVLLVSSTLYFKNYYDKRILSLTLEQESIRSDLESKVNLLNTLIINMQSDYDSKIDLIKKLLKKQSEESTEKLSQLEKDIKGISIEAGDFSAVIGDAIKGVVSVITDSTQASGTIISDDGLIITNFHVIQNAKSLGILTYNKEIYPAVVMGYDNINDIALLKINVTGLKDLNFADSDDIKIGEKVVALGNPAGLGFTATEGIISQVDRKLKGAGSVGLIQTDVPINPGNSGGPLISKEGKVIGINRLKIKDYESLSFAIPSNYVATIVKQILENAQQ